MARRQFVPGLAVAVLVMSLGANAQGQGKTDVVTLGNGDRITGEITRLDRGRLEFKTDDAGTLYLEWDNLVSLVASRLCEVVAADGRRFLGTLGPAATRSISVVSPGGTAMLAMAEVARIYPIGTSFWRKVDGSIDVGFNYTQSSGVAQLNLNWDTIYRAPAFQGRLSASLTATATETEEGSERDDRGSVEASYLRYPWRRWFISAAGRFETNESLGIELRSQLGGAVGPRLVNSNRAQLGLGAGLVVNDERGVNVDATQNIEALFSFWTSFYTYDRPTTNLDINLQYYPSLSNPGRQRVQLDAAIKREFWKDLFLTLSLYNSFDNEPPNVAANSNDVGVVLSLGWTY